MNIATIATITVAFAVSLYVIFLVLGAGGVAKNRRAQGLDHNQTSNK
tara:strand:- start:312 stop:452 length:141 start_codon:yes stop_codon:yes gene_type:complete